MADITLTPTQTFISGDTVLPATLNQLAQSTVALTAGTIVDADVSASAAILPSKLGAGALPAAVTVASANLVDGTIVNADINATADIAGSKLADAGITAAKLSGAQTGSAPIYGCRAWVNFDGTLTNVTGNAYSRTTTTVTVTRSAHGLTTGNKLVISSASDSGLHTAANTASAEIVRVDDNNFTFQTASTGPSTGTLTYARGIRGSGNVASVTRNGTGNYTVTFATALPSANYSAVASSGNLDASTGAESTTTTDRTTASFSVYTSNTTSAANRAEVSVVVFG
jgi:hypothetical protein